MANLATLVHPLNELLQKNKRWHWSKQCDEALAKAKQLLSEAPVLAHFDPKLPLCLAGDASAYGIGAVISHKYPNGEERPIAYASCTLSSSKKNYAQLEREALSLVFGVKNFHQFMYGRPFMLYTDHKPLTVIFNSRKSIPPLSAARLQRWSVILSAYDYTIAFKSTQLHGNVDGLSRLPLLVDRETKELLSQAFSMLDKLKICQLLQYNLEQRPDKIQFWLKCYVTSNKVGQQWYLNI